MQYSRILIALRSISKQKFYAILNIAGFSLGLSLVIFIGLYLFEQFSYDKWYKDHDRIYRVEMGDWAILAPVYARLIQSSSASIENTLRVNSTWGNEVNVKIENKKTALTIPHLVLADSIIFDFFDFTFLSGNAETALNTKDKIVLTRSQALRLFGKIDVIGEIVKVGEEYTFSVSGVIEDVNRFHFNVDALGSFRMLGDIYFPEYFESTGNWNHNTYIKLHPDADPKEVEKTIDAYLKDFFSPFSGDSPDRELRLKPVTDIYFSTQKMHEISIKHGNKTISYAFLLIAFFILIIAVINFVNLSTAQSAGRARETGIRKLLGSTRGNLMWQFLLESVLLTLVAVIISIAIVEIFLPYFNYVTNVDNSFANIGWTRLGITVFFGTLIIGILSGIYPAFYLSGFQPISSLKGELTKGRGAAMFRRLLIVFQFTISIALIAATIILYHQLTYLNQKDPGFAKENIVHFRLNSKVIRSWDSFRNSLLAHPAITSVGLSNAIPGQVRWQESFMADGKSFQFTYWPVDPEYFDMLELTLLNGRSFSPDMASDENVAVIINEQWAWQSGLPFNTYEDLLGLSFESPYRQFKIIGVVSDFHFNSLHDAIGPLVIAWRSDACYVANVKLNAHNQQSAIKHIEENWNALSPDVLLSYNYLEASLEKLYDGEKKLGIIFLSFSSFAVIIAIMGLFGMASFMVEKRTREFSIRKVLGASSGNILVLLSKEFFVLIVLAMIMAIPLSWMSMHSWLDSFSSRITITAVPFIIAGTTAILLMLVTIGYHVIKLSHTNPSDALNKE